MNTQIPTYRTFKTYLKYRSLPHGRGWKVQVRRPGMSIIPVFIVRNCSKEEAAVAIFPAWQKRLAELAAEEIAEDAKDRAMEPVS